MKLGERTVSYYEIMHGTGARWYWDRRYVSESELEDREPLPDSLLAAIDNALEKRREDRQTARAHQARYH